MKTINIIYLLLLAIGINGCSSSGDGDTASETTQSLTYSTTSAKGDYSEWTITGSQLDAIWNVINTTGSIDYTHNISADCGVADAMGVRSCSVTTSSCTDGFSGCPAVLTGSFNMMDVGGVALFIQIGSGISAELHVGFAKDSNACTQDVSGDYTFIRTGLGLNESFGSFRSDSNFITIKHSDFGFNTADNNATQTLEYRTNTETDILIDAGCVDGVRTRSTTGGTTMRSMMTANGLFVLDLPAGDGGLISFKVANAATLADFASKSFSGIAFPDNSPAEFVSADFSAVSGDKVGFTLGFGGGTAGQEIMSLATPATDTAPAYPDFTIPPISPTSYAGSELSATYPNPSTIPGLFKFGNNSDDGRVIIAAMKINGKVIGVGMVYNLRDTSDTNPATGTTFPEKNLYNTGNFIIFER